MEQTYFYGRVEIDEYSIDQEVRLNYKDGTHRQVVLHVAILPHSRLGLIPKLIQLDMQTYFVLNKEKSFDIGIITYEETHCQKV